MLRAVWGLEWFSEIEDLHDSIVDSVSHQLSPGDFHSASFSHPELSFFKFYFS